MKQGDDICNTLIINELPPPISGGINADKKWGTAKPRLTEQSFTLLEEVIDTAQRLGLRLNLKQQGILTAVLRGDSRRKIAETFDTTPREVAQQADYALQQLHCFLHRLAVNEKLSQEHQQELDLMRGYYQQRISELEAQLVSAREPENLRKALMASPIHRLPLSRPLQSVLLAGGLYSLEDILHSTCNELQQLPNMTPPLMRELTTYVRSMGMMYKE